MSGTGRPSPVPASKLGDRGVFIWQKALRTPSNTQRPAAEVRETLFTLALFMNADGTEGRPGNRVLGVPREVSQRTLVRHLQDAVMSGWLICVERGRRTGNTSRASHFHASFPADVFERLAELLCPVWGDCDGLPSQGDTHTWHRDPSETPQGDTHGRHLGPQGDTEAAPKVTPQAPKVPSGGPQGDTHTCHPTTHSHHSTPPPPGAAPARTAEDVPGPGPGTKNGGKDIDGDEHDQARADLAAEAHRRRPDWTPTAISNAITTALRAGRPLDHVAVVLPKLAADPDTTAPGRLNAAHGLWPQPPGPAKQYDRDAAEAVSAVRPEGIPDPDKIRPTAPPTLRAEVDKLRTRKSTVNYMRQSRPKPTMTRQEQDEQRAAELRRLAREIGTPAAPLAVKAPPEPTFCTRCQEHPDFCACPQEAPDGP